MKMKKEHYALLGLFILFVYTNADDCGLNQVAYRIVVDQSGHGNFSTIQQAIDNITMNNNQWIHIQVSPGLYKEKITIPLEKPCIFLEGTKGNEKTTVEWNELLNQNIGSATITSFPDYVIVKGITFKNTYNIRPQIDYDDVKPAIAAEIRGDKNVFFGCRFYGLQDTLWDVMGRHYYRNCYIEGGVDFIWGKGQSIYQNCMINVNLGTYLPTNIGFIIAQGRESPSETNGFVFTSCQFGGIGKVYLGRAWGPCSQVIIANSNLSEVIQPLGWDPWHFKQVEKFNFVEYNNQGPGADTSKRVSWVKKLNRSELNKFTSLSFINSEGWMEKLPTYS